jgi:hypothetical protein
MLNLSVCELRGVPDVTWANVNDMCKQRSTYVIAACEQYSVGQYDNWQPFIAS